MTGIILRNYLELRSLEGFKGVKKPLESYSVELVDPRDFLLNKFFYKNIGKNCQWVDRLIWSDKKWMDYISDEKIFTYILKEASNKMGEKYKFEIKTAKDIT